MVLGVLALAPGAPAPALRSRSGVLDDWRAGLAAYRAGRLGIACARFEQAVKRQPKNGATWADLGLCERRRGNVQRAVEASIRAVRYGERRVRLNASYNLWQLGVEAPLPDEVGQCLELRAPDGLECNTALNVCRGTDDRSGNGGGVVYQYVEVLPAGQKPGERDPALIVPLRGEAWATSKGCDYAWHLRTPLVERLTRRCLAQGHDESVCDQATREVLSAETGTGEAASAEAAKLVPLTAADRRRARRDADACIDLVGQAVAASTGPVCSLVLADPCRGAIEIVCDGRALDELKDAQLQSPRGHVADELSLD